jgi:hypothetical protein
MRRRAGFWSKLSEHFGGCIGALVQWAAVVLLLIWLTTNKR